MNDNEKTTVNTEGFPSDEVTEEEDSGYVICFEDDHTTDDSDDDSYKNGKSIISERINAAGGVEQREKYTKRKLPLREAIPNFFYHYKGHIFALLFMAFLVYVLISSAIPVKHDYDVVIYADNQPIDESITYLVSTRLAPYGKDLDGDGEVKVTVLYFDQRSEDFYKSKAGSVYIDKDLAEEHYNMLIITDKTYYDMIIAAYGEEFFTSYKGAPLWIPLADTEFLKEFEEYDITTELGLSLVAMTDEIAADEEMAARHEAACGMLEEIYKAHPEMFAAAE